MARVKKERDQNGHLVKCNWLEVLKFIHHLLLFFSFTATAEEEERRKLL